MSSSADTASTISVRLQHLTNELWEIQKSLTDGENVAPPILTDFRDAVNRVRNTAWAVEQYANSKSTQTDPHAVISVLAGERVRVAYQLCRLIQSDLANPDIQFQTGQLMHFRRATAELEEKLTALVGK